MLVLVVWCSACQALCACDHWLAVGFVHAACGSVPVPAQPAELDCCSRVLEDRALRVCLAAYSAKMVKLFLEMQASA